MSGHFLRVMRFVGWVLFLSSNALFAQQTGWQDLTISDGLSQGMIYDLVQDRKGFIWVATKDGLNRYDGHNFKVFTHDPYNPFSISDNGCSALLLDRHGRLWIGTISQGLNLYDDRTGRFHHMAISDQSAPNAGNYEIRLVTEDPDGNIWVGTSTGTFFKVVLSAPVRQAFPRQADFTKQVTVTPLHVGDEQTNRPNLHFSFHPNGRGLTGLENGIFSFHWRQPAAHPPVNLLTEKIPTLFDVHEDVQRDYLFFSTSHQLIGRHQGIRKTIPVAASNGLGLLINSFDKNTLLAATDKHLWLLSPTDLFGQDSLTPRNAFVALPAGGVSVTKTLKDKTGMIWVGTNGYGLRKFNPKVKQFQTYLSRTSLSNLYVDRQGRTYARSQLAYGQIDKVTNRLLPFLNPNLPAPDQRQRNLTQDRRGTFWVSNVNFETHSHQLIQFSTDWQLLRKYSLPAGITFGFVGNQTLEDQAGHLWIGATNGKLLSFEPQTGRFRVLSYQSLLSQRGAEVETYALLAEPDGSLWIGTQQGLIRAKSLATKPTFSIVKNARTNRQSLSNDFVLSLAHDPHQPARYLWVGTKGGGLDRLDKQTGQFRHFTEAQGLPNKVVYGILADEFKNLWVSTNRGLTQFNPKTFAFRNYTKADGLQDDEFNTGSFFKTPAGELLFGGVNGLTVFRPKEVSGQAGPAPQVRITGLKVNNEPVAVGSPDGVLTKTLEHTTLIDLAHTQNLLTLEFGVMDFTNSANNRYRYRLNGIDNNWVEAGTNRFANYAQLPNGHYTLQVMGSADGEVWSKPVELQIQVHPPMYRTGWAYLLYALLLAVIGWQVYRFQRGRLLLQQRVAFEQQEAIRLTELDGLKTRFFTNISHEFRTPLTLLLGPLADLKARFPAEPVLDLMARNGNRLLSLINQLLDLSKLEAGQLRPEPEPGNLAAFFRIIASSFESLAQNRRIPFTFEQSETDWWAYFDRDKLEKILTNLLSNAFKFTPAGRDVRMSVHYPAQLTGGSVIITVQDNGIGIGPAQLPHIFERFYQVDGKDNRFYEGTGIGLALVNELVRVLDGAIAVVSTEGVGTTFTVTLPLVAVARRPAHEAEMAPDEPTPSPTVAPTAASDSPASSAGEAVPTGDNTLLIIDDNADIRAYIRSIFQPEYQVIEAADGEEGLEQATAILPTVVICDLMMPRLDGFGFCSALKAQPATSHIPVVMLTAKATVEDRIEGFDSGADEYLNKPFNRAEIQARVRNLIEQRQRLYRWFQTNWPAPQVPATVPMLLVNEQRFIDRLTDAVVQHLSEPDFSVETLAEAVSLSRSQLHRKLKALVNTSPTNFVREVRLAKAATLLTEGDQSVTQVAYAVGFDNLSYFARMFQDRYGVLPSQYNRPPIPLP